MKKFVLSSFAVLLFISMFGCTTNTGTTNQGSSALKISDYYPFRQNVKYIYEGKGNEYASYYVFTDYVEGSKIQLRSNNGGAETLRVLENKDGQLNGLIAKGEIYYRENLLKSSNQTTNINILLKEPLIKGTTWTSPENKKRFISNVDVEIITPLGNYKTIEVTTENDDSKIVDYYAPNIGLVKTVYLAKDFEVSSTLSKIETDVLLTQNIKFYYPNINDNKLYYVFKKLSFKTNDVTRQAFEKTFKESPPNQNLGKLLSPNAKINSLYLNADGMVYVDFSKELVTEMNAGSGYESMILQSITNTLGEYYGVEKVYITIEGNPYSSGHIQMKKGEAFKVNTKNNVELK